MLYRPDHARALVFPFVFIGFVISLCLHEFGHAIVAYHCGDRTVRDKGYLTLDPLRYTDLQYSILFPLMIMALGGIGLPGGAVYINTQYLRRRAYGALVSAGGPLGTAVVLAVADGGVCGGAATRQHRAGAVRGAGIPGAAAGDGADLQPASRVPASTAGASSSRSCRRRCARWAGAWRRSRSLRWWPRCSLCPGSTDGSGRRCFRRVR